jgi:23S rRNA pseudouridine1911/1915/1917 synthase
VAPEFSRSHLQTLINDGLVAVNGAGARAASQRLKAGDRVRVELRPTAESLAFRPEPMAMPIVHEDEHVLVIDKPAGWVVHPAAGHWSGTLLNGLLAHHAQAAHLPRAGIVHRLDKDTSGLMVVGKTLPAVTALVRAIAARHVRRTYLALAQGEMPVGARVVEAPIGRDPFSRLRMAVQAGGRPALTRIECLGAERGVSRLVCRLHTGRTHQIRVHAASLGHPLLGDILYGSRPHEAMQRQALHAAQLALAHPQSGRWMCFRSALPPDLDQVWRATGGALPVDLEADAQPIGVPAC